MTPASFIDLLKNVPALPNVFNPWRDYDPENDISRNAPDTRAENLRRYLEKRAGKARLVLVGEAPGYQGCKFSGIAMTSERILLDRQPSVPSCAVFDGDKERTSKVLVFPQGAIEPTATITWGLLLGLGLAPEEFVFWNAFYAHPHKSGMPLTNRSPTPTELKTAGHVLPALLEMLPDAQVVAVGRVAQRTLSGLGIAAPEVRHPAMGGATKFRQQVRDLLGHPA